jgi:Fe-S-cluster containining protein
MLLRRPAVSAPAAAPRPGGGRRPLAPAAAAAAPAVGLPHDDNARVRTTLAPAAATTVPPVGSPQGTASSDNARVLARFAEIDARTAALAAALPALRCAPGCGACCTSPTIDASAYELGPLAAAAVAAPDGGEVLMARLDAAAAAGSSVCVLYEPAPGDGSRGRCAAYELRPLVCRLFGYSASGTKDGGVALAACRVMREAAPEGIAAAEARVASGATAAPVLRDEAARLHPAQQDARQRPIPINEALREALQVAALRALVDAAAGSGSGSDEEGRGGGRPE